MLLELESIDDLVNATFLLVGLGESAHMKCTTKMFSLTVCHRSPRFMATLETTRRFFSRFHSDRNNNIHHSRILLRPFYSIILAMQRRCFSSMSLLLQPPHDRLFLQFWNPRDAQGLLLSRRLELARSVEEDLGQIDLGTFVSIESRVFRRIVTEFSGYLVRVTLTSSHVKFSTGVKELLLAKEERQCIIEGVTRGVGIEFLITLYPITFFHNMTFRSERVWFFKTTYSYCMIVAPYATFAQFKVYFPPM